MSEEISVAELRSWAAINVMGWTPSWSEEADECSVYALYSDSSNEEIVCRYQWRPDSDLNQLAQVVRTWCGSDLNRWTEFYHNLPSWCDSEIECALKTIFTNPELCLRALHACVIDEVKL